MTRKYFGISLGKNNFQKAFDEENPKHQDSQKSEIQFNSKKIVTLAKETVV